MRTPEENKNILDKLHLIRKLRLFKHIICILFNTSMKIFRQPLKENHFSILTNHFEESSREDINSIGKIYREKKCCQSINLTQDEPKFSSDRNFYAAQLFQNITQTLKLKNLIIGFTALKYAPIIRCSSYQIISSNQKFQEIPGKFSINQRLKEIMDYDSARKRSMKNDNFLLTPKTVTSKDSQIHPQMRHSNKKSIIHNYFKTDAEDNDLITYCHSFLNRNRSLSQRRFLLREIGGKLEKSNQTHKRSSSSQRHHKFSIHSTKEQTVQSNDNHLPCKIRRLQKLVKNIKKEKHYQNMKNFERSKKQQIKRSISITEQKSRVNKKPQILLLSKQLQQIKRGIKQVKDQNTLILNMFSKEKREEKRSRKKHKTVTFEAEKKQIQHSSKQVYSYGPKSIPNPYLDKKIPSIKCEMESPIESSDFQCSPSRKSSGFNYQAIILNGISIGEWDKQAQNVAIKRFSNQEEPQISYNYSKTNNQGSKEIESEKTTEKIFIKSETFFSPLQKFNQTHQFDYRS